MRESERGSAFSSVAAKEPARMKLGEKLFALDESIRYVAVNQSGQIVEMTQNPRLPTSNPHETDRFEETLVNPVILQLAVYRGNLDMDGTRYVMIRYGTMYELIFPYAAGHLSVGVELSADPPRVAEKIAKELNLRM